MSFGYITPQISTLARELNDRDKVLTQLEGVFKTALREAALRNDSEADDIGDALIDELDRPTMRQVVRAMLRNEGAEALRVLNGCFQSAYDKTVERHAEEALPDAIDSEVREAEERLDRKYG
jgi:hypothetical protein